MKIHEIDNSLNNLGKTVLWQYDRAVRLLSVMKHMQVLYHCAVEQFWQFWMEKVLAIDTCGAFGCSVWGIFLGVPRPTVKDEDGKERLIVTSVYRKILKGTFYLMKASSSFDDILGYLEIIFGVGGEENLSKWSVYVSEYGWTTNIDELNDVYKSGIAYAKGDIFSYDRLGEGILRNWKCTRDISKAENTSFDAIADYVVSTNEPTNGVADDETLLLKLYDPEGICRKIGGAPNNSLSITVEYEFGETTIRAVATRRRKCGVTLTDNEDLSMEYGKSAYYDEMHRDQKLLFEQRLSDFCPYPLGIKTNAPVAEVVFGFAGQENAQYQSGIDYEKGDVFGYISDDGTPYNYECISPISASQNSSFDSIEEFIKRTNVGDPFVGGFVDSIPPYNDYSSIRFTDSFIIQGNMAMDAFQTIFPELKVGRISPLSSFSVWNGIAVFVPLRKLFKGKHNGLIFVYKIDKPNRQMSVSDYEIITDGVGYCAYYTGDYLTILTKKLTTVASTLQSGFAPAFFGDSGRSTVISFGIDWFDKFGITDAIGDIGEKMGLDKYPLNAAIVPIDGMSYANTTEFQIEGKKVVKVGVDEYKPLGTTSLISNSTLTRLNQKG